MKEFAVGDVVEVSDVKTQRTDRAIVLEVGVATLTVEYRGTNQSVPDRWVDTVPRNLCKKVQPASSTETSH